MPPRACRRRSTTIWQPPRTTTRSPTGSRFRRRQSALNRVSRSKAAIRQGARMTTVPSLTLNNGVEIPQLGFGVFLVQPEATVETLSNAIEIGYRHIDTAQGYRNEREVGQAIKGSGID